ncbi:MAG TPA: fumarylacetoacetate hydrolase family protein [Burkholderiales bacterium]|nr:fumarylacetoacetate hydrolase family protein [Burkholderiales bacterium]
MRFLTFMRDGSARVGVLRDSERVLDVREQAGRLNIKLPFDASDMLALISSGAAGLAAVRKLLQTEGADLALAGLKLLAPIPRPRKNVFCVGWNYLEHFAEGETIRHSGQDLPAYPVFFSKTPTAVSGPYDAIPYDAKVSEQIDWEAELAVIIGKNGKNISENEALDYVFGYTVVNDVTARDLQRRHGGQWLKGKSLDGACPMGPWIVTRDELDPNNLRVVTRVNGVPKQDSNTRHLYFKIPRLIAELSLGMTLEAGDIISTGTPPGVGFARKPPEFLMPGDLLETEIEGIGRLQNRIVS